jgi:predicted DNA-binding WGR domain protein
MGQQERFDAFGFCEMTQINPERNRYRYYSISIQPGLFEVSVQRSWGRVGGKTRTKDQFFADLQEAVRYANLFYRKKSGRGYCEQRKDHA